MVAKDMPSVASDVTASRALWGGGGVGGERERDSDTVIANEIPLYFLSHASVTTIKRQNLHEQQVRNITIKTSTY
jgi:hypothetical protein